MITRNQGNFTTSTLKLKAVFPINSNVSVADEHDELIALCDQHLS